MLAGKRSILFRRMNVSSLMSGAMVEGIFKEKPVGAVPVSASGAESTQSDTSADCTLNATAASVAVQIYAT